MLTVLQKICLTIIVIGLSNTVGMWTYVSFSDRRPDEELPEWLKVTNCWLFIAAMLAAVGFLVSSIWQ